jgi:hypothetical protein
MLPGSFGHDVPIRGVHRQSTTSPYDLEVACTSTLASSREYLRRILGSELKCFIRFLELPAEIRLLIYENVFRVDGVLLYNSNLMRGVNDHILGFQVLRDRLEGEVDEEMSEETEEQTDADSDDSEAWELVEHDPWTGPSENLLCLLLSNRQIFQEAMPVFYNTNTFKVQSLSMLSKFLSNCGAAKRLHLARIEFSHHDSLGKRATKKAFDLLAQAKHLQYLKILTLDRFYLFVAEPRDVYWVQLLRKLNVASIHVDSEGGRIEAYVQEERSRKAKEVKQVKSKKQSTKKQSTKKQPTKKQSPPKSHTYGTRAKEASKTT